MTEVFNSLNMQISKKLTEGYTHHNYLIEYNEAKTIGLNVKTPDAKTLIKVDELYQIQLRINELMNIDRTISEY